MALKPHLRHIFVNPLEVNASEAAVLVVLPSVQPGYDPIYYPENNIECRDKTLENMLEQGYVTQAEYDEAMADRLYPHCGPRRRTERGNNHLYLL
ncbi:MAG: hypothetical protein V8R85_00995 [Frisingicoccus sp.]